MNELRKKFEGLPEIMDLLSDKEKSFFFNDDFGVYGAEHLDDFDAGFINGAWYAFQEQQKNIDAITNLCNNKRGDIHWQVDSFIEEIEELLK